MSAKTAFLLAGTKPGPEKLRKCEKLGVPVVSEEEFRAMLPDGSLSAPAVPADAGREHDGPTLEEPTLF